MSGINQYSQDTDNLQYGFLAAKSVSAINKLLQSEELNKDDEQSLSSAKQFLRNVSEGINLVSSGSCENVSPTKSLKILNYAMAPIENLQVLIADQEVTKFFEQLANAFPENRDVYDKDKREKELQITLRFFEALYSSLLEAINAGNRTSRQLASNDSFSF